MSRAFYLFSFPQPGDKREIPFTIDKLECRFFTILMLLVVLWFEWGL